MTMTITLYNDKVQGRRASLLNLLFYKCSIITKKMWNDYYISTKKTSSLLNKFRRQHRQLSRIIIKIYTIMGDTQKIKILS